jgi:hypothetical protein
MKLTVPQQWQKAEKDDLENSECEPETIITKKGLKRKRDSTLKKVII